MTAEGNDRLLLKWGTLKGWDFDGNEKAQELLRRYGELGWALGAMQQRDTPEQKELLCQLIDACDGPITNDWSGEDLTKEAAKEYVLNYGRTP